MKLVPIKEASEFLNVKESTIYSWTRKGIIPSYKLNGVIRFDIEELREWIKNSRTVAHNVTIPSRKTKTLDIDKIIKKAVDDVTGKRYNPSKRETSLNQGLRKEV